MPDFSYMFNTEDGKITVERKGHCTEAYFHKDDYLSPVNEVGTFSSLWGSEYQVLIPTIATFKPALYKMVQKLIARAE